MKKGCGCLFVTLGSIIGVIVIFLASRNADPGATVPSNPIAYTFVDSNYDRDGNFMELYAVNGQIDFEEFRQLCLKFKNRRTGLDHTQCIVLFDSVTNAAFPRNPYTAQYGMDLQILKHIKAFYTFNPLNGYSELVPSCNEIQRVKDL